MTPIHIVVPPIVTIVLGLRYGMGWLAYNWENTLEKPRYTGKIMAVLALS